MKLNEKSKLRELGIAAVYLFGSKAIGTSTPMSDMDIGVVLKEPKTVKDTRVLYTALYDVFVERYPARELDIVFLQTAPIPLQYHAIKEGRILYEEDPRFTADYVANVINGYLDFKPVLEYFDTISSARYAHA
jgi:predicted nucleotidyltransferase